MSARRFRKLFKALDELGGPLVQHDHKAGYENCPACQLAHPLAPHFSVCQCGHCPDPDAARAAVTEDLLFRTKQAEKARKEDGHVLS